MQESLARDASLGTGGSGFTSGTSHSEDLGHGFDWVWEAQEFAGRSLSGTRSDWQVSFKSERP